MRNKIVAGNWKMNMNFDEGQKLASEVINMTTDEVSGDVEVVLIPPFIHLSKVKSLIGQQSNVSLGAQNCNENESGAYTGEVSASMLSSVGCDYVVLGHSERRQYYDETDEWLTKKVEAVLSNGLKTIFCFGESLEIRENGTHVEYVIDQLKNSVFKIDESKWGSIVLAYEPIWAIGTGKTASSTQAQEMHKEIRDAISSHVGPSVAVATSILYGGSVKPSNSKELFAQPDVDGGLIGGASLNSRDFIDIATSY